MGGHRSLVRAHARSVAEHPRRALLTVLLVGAVSSLLARDVRLDNNFAALFATSSEEARFREDYRATFGPDDGLLAVVLTIEGDGEGGPGQERAADGEDLAALAEVADGVSRVVASVEGVARVNSPTVTELIAPGVTEPTPAFGPGSAIDARPPADRLALARSSGLGSQFLVSADGRTMLVVGELEADLDSYEEVVGPAERFRAAVDDHLAGPADRPPVRADFAGVAFTRVAAIEQMQSDLLALSPLATVVMAVLLWAFFRRALAVLAPLVAIGVSLVATAGIIGVAGDDLNQVTVIYPILLMGVVVASATHLIDRYYRERAAGRDAGDAARVTIERVLPGAFVANLTTAIGFASLVTGRMQILHEFGLYLAAGVMAAWAIGVTAVPAILVLGRAAPPPRYAAARHVSPASWTGPTTRTERSAWVLTGRWAAPLVLLAGVAVVGASAVAATTAHYDYALADMLASGDPTSLGNAAIDGELAGIIPVEVSLQGPQGAFADADVVDRARRLDAFITAELGTRPTGVPALVDDLAAAGFTEAGDDPAAALDLVAITRPDALDRLVTSDRSHARIAGFVPDHGGRWVLSLRDRIEAEGTRLFVGTGVEVRVTGEAPVAYDGMNLLTRELVVSALSALAVIIVAIAVALRSAGLGLVALLPNLVPVVGGMGLYALTSDVLDPLPGLVFCIAAGLAADDTIHLINRWREHRELAPPGADPRLAVVTALSSARTAMVASTVVLVAGFATLALSGFGWNRELGLLGAAVLVLALVADMVLCPAALAVYAGWRDRRDPSIDEPQAEAAEPQARLGLPVEGGVTHEAEPLVEPVGGGHLVGGVQHDLAPSGVAGPLDARHGQRFAHPPPPGLGGDRQHPDAGGIGLGELGRR